MVVRDKWIHIKSSSSERSEWQAMASKSGVSLADLIREKLGVEEKKKRSGRPHRVAPRVDPAFLREVARIGNNINQLARRCNTERSAPSLSALYEIEELLKELINAHQVP